MSGPQRWELALGEGGYPEQLLHLNCPPRRLYGIGDPTALEPGLGVVGARRATPYGIHCAREFAGWAAAAGIVVVSGAAIGCDLEAHRAALDADGITVAVLGCGADVDYPSSAANTLARIRRTGAVVSEMPWGSPAHRRAFVPRNRIIAGLSAALLVVEAGLPSGTFTTADFALEAGHDVLAVPGSIRSPGSRGPNRLIRQGAFAVTDVADLAASLRGAGLDVYDPFDPGTPTTANDPLLAALIADPMRPDDAARATSADIVHTIRHLAALEEAGLIERHADGRYGPPADARRYTRRTVQSP